MSKKIRFFNFICYVLLLMNSPSLYSDEQQTISLHEVLAQVQTDSFELQKNATQVALATAQKTQIKSIYFPTLSLNVTNLWDEKYSQTDVNMGNGTVSMPQILSQSAFTFNAQLPLFDGWVTSNKYHAAASFEEAAQNNWDWNKFKLQREAILQFYRVLAAQLLEQVAQQNIVTLEDHLKNMTLMKKVGSATQFDVLKVQVQLSNAQAELLNIQDNISLEKNKLAILMGKANETRTIMGEFPTFDAAWIQQTINTLNAENSNLQNNAITVSADHIDQIDHEHRLDLVALQLKEMGYEQLVTAQNRHWVPKIYLFGQYQSYNNRSDQFDDFNLYRDAYQVGIGLSWNIFDGFASSGKAQEALQQRSLATIELAEQRTKKLQNLALWQRKLNYAALLTKTKSNEVQQATESLRLAQAGLKVGTRTNKDLLDAENELFNAQAAMVQSKLDTVEALIQLELSSGSVLYSFH